MGDINTPPYIMYSFRGLHAWGGNGYTWHPGINQAKCIGEREHSEKIKAPASKCMCGFWMKEYQEQLNPEFRGALSLRGAVQAWGTCREHTNGWRCEYMQIIAFCVNPDIPMQVLKEVSEKYDVPLLANEVELQKFVDEYNTDK